MWKICYYHAANDCLITVENCIFKTSLPFFKVFYQHLSHRANITATQYHCRRQYHASGISLPKATRFPFREMRRTLLFWNRIVGGGNAHSFACVRLFPTGTQYPAGTPIWQCLAMTYCALHRIYYLSKKIILMMRLYFPLKRREFDEIVVFSAGSENPSVRVAQLRFWNHVIACDNAHSFARVRLFLHASTKVSCVGFIIWFPSGGLLRYARNDIVLRTE